MARGRTSIVRRLCPVAALAPYNSPAGTVAMTTRPELGGPKGWEEGRPTFIVGAEELPVLDKSDNPKQQLYDLLNPWVEKLGFSPKLITGLSGLALHRSVLFSSPIPYNRAPDGRRTIRLLPFRVDLSRQVIVGSTVAWYPLHDLGEGYRNQLLPSDFPIAQRLKASRKPKDTPTEDTYTEKFDTAQM